MVELFSKDFDIVTLKINQCVEKIKRHSLILKVIITNLKSYLLFMTFSNFYFIINNYKV